METKKLKDLKLQLVTPNKKFETDQELSYCFDGWMFAFANRNSHKITQGTVLMRCRESLLFYMHAELSKVEECVDDREFSTIPFSVGRTGTMLAVCVPNNLRSRRLMERKLSIGVRLTNLFAKIGNWTPTEFKTVDTSVAFKRNGNIQSHMIFYIEADRRWVFSPYMYSLFLLLLRCGKQQRFRNTSTLNNFLKKVGNFVTTEKYSSSDPNLINDIGGALPTIFKNYDTIFKGRTITTNWNYDHLSIPNHLGMENVAEDGINNLLRGDEKYCYDRKIRKKVYKAISEELKE